jgi:hypothetical protein
MKNENERAEEDYGRPDFDWVLEYDEEEGTGEILTRYRVEGVESDAYITIEAPKEEAQALLDAINKFAGRYLVRARVYPRYVEAQIRAVKAMADNIKGFADDLSNVGEEIRDELLSGAYESDKSSDPVPVGYFDLDVPDDEDDADDDDDDDDDDEGEMS